MNKYIIKNCPALRGWVCNKQFIEQDEMVDCQDCTDCVMKRIVELCKNSIRENERNIYRAGRMSLAINILDKLEIQEVE